MQCDGFKYSYVMLRIVMRDIVLYCGVMLYYEGRSNVMVFIMVSCYVMRCNVVFSNVM